MNIFAQPLEATFKELNYVLSTLTEEQLNKVPFEGSWTAGQVGDHLLKSYGVADAMNGRTKPADRRPDLHVETIKKIFLDFSTKLKSPDFIVPGNEHINQTELMQQLAHRTTSILNAAQTEDPTEICLDFAFPTLGHLTRFETTAFVLFHTQRHIHQLRKMVKVLGH